MVSIGNFFLNTGTGFLFFLRSFIHPLLAIIFSKTIWCLLLYLADQYWPVHYLPRAADPWINDWPCLYCSGW